MNQLRNILLGLVLCLIVLANFMANDYNFNSDGSEEWLLDDRDTDKYPPAPFRAMSEYDTKEINIKIDEWFQKSLEWEILSDANARARSELICKYYDSFCNKIEYDKGYTDEQRFTFLLYSIKIVSEIDENILLEWVKSLGSQLSKINFLNDENWPRGQAWFSVMNIRTPKINSKQEFFEVLVHEVAHVLSLSILSGIDNNSPVNNNFLVFDEAIYKDNDLPIQMAKLSRENEKTSFNQSFVSGYSTTHNQEAFAEFFNTRVNHHAPLIKLAVQDETIKKKYMLMRKVFGTWFIDLDIDTYKSLPLNTIPFDSTRFDGVTQPLHEH